MRGCEQVVEWGQKIHSQSSVLELTDQKVFNIGGLDYIQRQFSNSQLEHPGRITSLLKRSRDLSSLLEGEAEFVDNNDFAP